jgi:hypothetical protein
MRARAGIFGLLLGYTLSRTGFTDFGELHRMFGLEDLRLLFIFAGGVVLVGLGFAWLARGQALAPKPLHKGSVAGGVLFGAGWALSGACPGAAFAQLGEGRLPALVTIAGIAIGTFAYQRVHARFLRWDRGACGE